MNRLNRDQLVNLAKSEIREISVHELKQQLEEGAELALVDIRERDEWVQGHLPGATFIPRGFLELQIEQHHPNRDTTLVVYCALMLSISWELTLLATALFPLLVFSMGWIIRQVRTISRVNHEATREQSEWAYNLITCMPLVKVYGFRDDMDTMMRASDLLVGKAGGLTVSEALATGLPLIIYNPVPGQEMYNVDFLVNYGAGMWARDAQDVVEKVRFLSTHPGRLEQMAANASDLGRPLAVQTIAERVLAAVQR